MKKVLKRLLCTGICFVGLYNGVNAATLAVGNDTTTPGAINRSVSLELRDDDLSNYSTVSFQLAVSGTSYAEITGFAYSSAAGLPYSPNGNTYTIGAAGSTLKAANLGTISYKTTENLASDFKITPVNVVFTKADGSGELRPGDSGIKVQEGTIKYEKVKSKEACLSGITVSQGALSPEFNKDVLDYTVVVKDTINTIRISTNPCTGATTTGTGTKPLVMGENNFEIVATSEDGSNKKTYNVKVVRGEIAEPSAFLKDLTVNNIGVALSPEFDSKNNKYSVTIGEEITKLDIKYETLDPLAKVEIEGNENFKEGENQVTITIVASDESDTQFYELTVIKEAGESIAEPLPKDDEDKEEKKSNKTLIIVIIVVVILLIVGGVTFLLFRKKNQKKKQEEEKLPLKRRDNTDMIENTQIRKESTQDYDEDEDKYEYEETSEKEYIESDEYERDMEDASITEILKGELFDDDRTRKFDSSALKDYQENDYEEEEKTKEFDFKNLE